MTREKFTYMYSNIDRTQRTQKSGGENVLRFWQTIEKMEQFMFNVNTEQTHICLKNHFYHKVNGIIWMYEELDTDIYIFCTGTYKLPYFWANWLKTCSGMNASSATKNVSSSSFDDFHLFFWRSSLPKTSNSPKIQKG